MKFHPFLNKFFPIFFLLFVILTPVTALAEGYKIKIKAAGVRDTMCYLAYYYGDKQYLKDSMMAGPKGDFTFSGKETLPGGIYLIVLPGKKYFEVIVDEDQEFYWEADFNQLDDFSAMKTTGSADNKMFLDYSNFVNEKGKKSNDLKLRITVAKENGDSLLGNSLKDSVAAIDKQVEAYKRKIISDHPKSFLAMVFKAMFEPEIPETPVLPNGRPDSTFRYRYYKDHYWDNIDFNDDRIVRTPVYHTKLKTYITQLTLQIPDSINKSADIIIEKTRPSKELFKYTVWFVTYNYETSNIMGMDAVFVHMAEKYYMTKEAYWVDEATQFKITDRAVTTKPLLLGKTAPNLVMKNHKGLYTSMHDVKAKYTVLVFWDPDCGHCKKEVPVIDSIYQIVKSQGVEVFAVCTEREFDKWKKYITDHNLTWINVADSTLFFKRIYDINSTPIIYLLDADKKIVAKKISAHQLGDLLERKFKEDLILHD